MTGIDPFGQFGGKRGVSILEQDDPRLKSAFAKSNAKRYFLQTTTISFG
jgi:hypothetical protein